MEEEEIKENVVQSFIDFFRYIKGYQDWTDEEILSCSNNDDINEFIDYIKKSLNYNDVYEK